MMVDQSLSIVSPHSLSEHTDLDALPEAIGCLETGSCLDGIIEDFDYDDFVEIGGNIDVCRGPPTTTTINEEESSVLETQDHSSNQNGPDENEKHCLLCGPSKKAAYRLDCGM
jgi:hypothetical protein